VFCDGGGSLTNCLIGEQNQAPEFAGAYLKGGGELINCTVAGNYATGHGGGICTSNGGAAINTIIYNNTAIFGGENWWNIGTGAAFTYCCTTPTNNLPNENHCLPENPQFISSPTNFHLTSVSPCRNAGVYMPWMASATDLDGNPRSIAGQVDIGCYEIVPEGGMVFSILCSVFSIFVYRRKLNL